MPFAAPSLALFCFGFFGVFAFLSIGSSSAGPLTGRFSHDPAIRYSPGRLIPNRDRIPVMPLHGEYEPGTSAWSRKQTELYEATGGAQGGVLSGKPVIVLTSVGARTGKLRKVALMRVEHDGRYAVVASLGGAARNPVWYRNLTEQPHVELQDGATKRDYTAREVDGAEKAIWWERAVAVWPDYARYQRKTERQIPVFVLEPLDDAEPGRR